MSRRFSIGQFGLKESPISGHTSRGHSRGFFASSPTSASFTSAAASTSLPYFYSSNMSLPVVDYSPNNNLNHGSASRLYKVIVIGEVATGKSALIKRYVHNYYGNRNNYRATVGVDFQLKIIKFNEDLEIRLQLWDIAGQERFSSMTRAYYKGAVGAIVVFDQTDVRTFHAALERWKTDLDAKVKFPGSEHRNIPVVLVCNKSDLAKDSRLPSDFEISKIVHDRGFVPKWIKTSAKSGDGVSDAFSLIVRYVMAMDSWSTPMLDPDSAEFSFTSTSTTNSTSLCTTPNVSGFNHSSNDVIRLKKSTSRRRRSNSQQQQCLC